MQSQQRAQLLIQRRFRHHPAAITQREGEAVQLLFLPGHLQRAQMPPVHLRLLARCRLEAPHGHDSFLFPVPEYHRTVAGFLDRLEAARAR